MLRMFLIKTQTSLKVHTALNHLSPWESPVFCDPSTTPVCLRVGPLPSLLIHVIAAFQMTKTTGS